MVRVYSRFRIASVITALILLACVPKDVWASRCTNPEEPDEPIVFGLSCSNPSSPCIVRCGTLTLTAGAYDIDCWWYPEHVLQSCMDGLSIDWEGTWNRDGGGHYSGEWEVGSNAPGTQSWTFTVSDGGCGNDDGDVSRTATVTRVGIGTLTGPSRVCAREWAQFTATTTPIQVDDFIEWETTDDLGRPVTGEGPGFGTLWNTAPATHIVTAKSGTCSKSMRVDVEAPPECESNECNDGSGGGCPTPAFPTPGLVKPQIPIGLIVPLPIGGPGAGLGGNAGLGGCKAGTIDEYRCGGPYGPIIVLYYDACSCYRVDFTGCPLPCTLPMGNGGSMTRNPSGSYTVTDADGSVRQMSVPPEGPDMVKLSRPMSITDPNNNVTTFNREADGGLNSVSLPNGDTWLYTHDPDDDKIKKITAPDNETTTEVTYVTSGLAMNQIDTVKVYDRPSEPRNLISEAGYTYDSQGRVTQVTKDGKTVTYQYDVDGPDTITVTDTSATPQVVTVYQYGGDTTTVTRRHSSNPEDPLNQVTTYTFYTSGGKKTYVYQVTDPLNNTTTYCTYVQSNPLGDCTLTTSDPELLGKVYRVTDALGRQTDYDYDADTGALTKITYPAVGGVRYTEEYTYYLDSQSNKTQWLRTVKNVRGNYTHYVRAQGSLHRVDAVKVSAPVGGQEPNWDTIDPIRAYEYYPNDDPYDQKGLLKKETVPDIDGTIDQEREYEYWEMVGGQPKLRSGVTRAKYQYWTGSAYAWGTDHTAYDAMGNVLSTTDENGRSITYTYDKLRRQLTTTYATGRVVESHYNCCALEWVKDEDGREVHYAYDGAKRVTDMWTNLAGQSQASPLVHYTYDSFGNISTVITYSDASTARVTQHTYDKNNRDVRIDYPAPLGFEEFQYDEVGHLRGKKDGENVVTAYEYDELNRLTKVDCNHGSWPVVPISSPDVTYEYDGGSPLRTRMTDSSGTSEYTYDVRDRLETYTPPQPALHAALIYAYNDLDEKTSISTTGYVVSYAYYANGWLKQVASGGPLVASYTYDSVGNRDRVNLSNGTYTTYGYDTDPRYRMSLVAHYRDGTPPILLAEITYPDRDGSGNPLRMVDWTGTTEYTYDMNSRLDSATYPIVGLVDYNYDWVGNRVNPPAPPNPMEFNAADELTRWPSQHQYDYDGAGNLTREWSDPRGVDPQKTYTYAGANLLASVQHGPGGPVSQMSWDADANRVGFTSSMGGAYTYVYDTTAGIPAVIEEATGGAPVYYLREPNGSLIARIAGSVRYYHFDALGSTRTLTDASGAITDTYTYDAWANVTGHTGTTQHPYHYVGRLGYYTHWQDSAFGLLQLGVRFYEPQTGRLTQRDPIRDGLNWYAYANNRPTVLVDPDGLLAGRYRSLCADFCSKSDWCNKVKCWICKKGVDALCKLNPDECCSADKAACFDDCVKRFDEKSKAYHVCKWWCEGRYQACLANGKPFELPPLPPPKPCR